MQHAVVRTRVHCALNVWKSIQSDSVVGAGTRVRRRVPPEQKPAEQRGCVLVCALWSMHVPHRLHGLVSRPRAHFHKLDSGTSKHLPTARPVRGDAGAPDGCGSVRATAAGEEGCEDDRLSGRLLEALTTGQGASGQGASGP